MTVLTNNIDLSVRLNEEGEVGLIDIPEGSEIYFVDMSPAGYHAYYEIHTYRLNCRFNGKNIIISCSKYVGGKQPKVDCVKGNLHSRKIYYWSEVFNEEFPKWSTQTGGEKAEKIQEKEN